MLWVDCALEVWDGGVCPDNSSVVNTVNKYTTIVLIVPLKINTTNNIQLYKYNIEKDNKTESRGLQYKIPLLLILTRWEILHIFR